MLAPEDVARYIRDTARSVILPRFRALKREDMREKKPGDMVTIADTEAEQILTQLLTTAAPGSAVLGEEGVFEDSSRFKLAESDAPFWVIDPIDGTGNFVRGETAFAVLVAYVEGGKIMQGWIYEPLTDRMVWAIAGGGVWYEGKRIRLSPPPLKKQVGSIYGRAASGQRAEKEVLDSNEFGGVDNYGSGGVEYLKIALGELQFSLHSRSFPWDHAAGMLVIPEAGGKSCFLDGTPYSLRIHDKPVLAAANDVAWERLRDIVTRPATVP